MRVAISAIILKEGKILLVKKRETWILPGGKPERDESDLDCLAREINEELSGAELTTAVYFGEFEGMTPHKFDLLINRVYLAEIDIEQPVSTAEIKAIAWTDRPKDYNLSDITLKIVNSLAEKGYFLSENLPTETDIKKV